VAEPEGLVFCPTAADRAFDMAETLKKAGIETISTEIYTQEACPPNADAVALLAKSGPVILPIFSARSGRLAAAAFASRPARLLIAAISEQVAAEARALAPERMVVASTPDAEALIAAIAKLADSSESG
jgi:uroporphyrinogen-III synthase